MSWLSITGGRWKSARGSMVALTAIALLTSCSSTSSPTSPAQNKPIITWTAPASVTVGTILTATQLDATANVAGTFTYSPAVGAALMSAGVTTLSVTFTPTDASTYSTASASVSLTVNPATPLITWPTPAAILAGTALSPVQLDATASVAGTFAYSPPAGTVLPVGSNTLAATFTPADSMDYTAATAQVTLTVSPVGPPSYSWTNVKIVGGGYITGVYFHPAQQNLMYARTDVGGAYRWGPHDTQWVPLLDWTSSANWQQMGVEAIGLDPTNANNLYIAVGEYSTPLTGVPSPQNGAMLVSTDQGNSFTSVALPFRNGSDENGRNAGERIAVDPNQPSILYFGTRLAGLQISTNSGASWSHASGLPVTTTANGSGVIAVLPWQHSGSAGTPTPVVYAAVAGTGKSGDPVGLFVTTSGGTAAGSWAEVTGQPNFSGASAPLAPLHAVQDPNGAIYILYGDQPGPESITTSQLWKFVPASNWTSGTWTQIKLPNTLLNLNGTNGYGGLAVDPSQSGVLMLGTMDQVAPTGEVVYRSTDDGSSWRDVSSVKITPTSPSPDQATHDGTLSPYLALGGTASTISTGTYPSSIAIDPFNSAHGVYGTLDTVWATSNLTAGDSGQIVNWAVGANGIENTEVPLLLAPPSGNTLLLSSNYQLVGFAHQDLSTSPTQQMFTNPMFVPSAMDFEQNSPTTVVRTGIGTDSNGSYGAPYGSISIDGGVTWTAFASTPPFTTTPSCISYTCGIAIAGDGSSIVWSPPNTDAVWYSTNLGATWTVAVGIAPQAQVVSDRVKPGVFYGFDGSHLTVSTNGGATWTTAQSGLAPQGTLISLPDAQGDLWMAGSSSGLYTNTGTAALPSLTLVSGVQDAFSLGFGAAALNSTKLTLYLDGQIANVNGIFRSTDGGAHWLQINDSQHQWGAIDSICGDMRTFGTVYVGTSGRGIVWGTSLN